MSSFFKLSIINKAFRFTTHNIVFKAKALYEGYECCVFERVMGLFASFFIYLFFFLGDVIVKMNNFAKICKIIVKWEEHYSISLESYLRTDKHNDPG